MQVVDHLDARTVDVSNLSQVDYEPEYVVRYLVGDRGREPAGIRHVDLAVEIRNDHSVLGPESQFRQ